MSNLLQYPFFLNALFMSALLSLLFGMISFFVVYRKMTFLGTGIAHTAFGGVAIGVFTGINPFLSALFFCSIVAVFIGKLTRFSKMSYDASIGLFFSFSMALGALLIALKKAYTFDLSGYLFGNILGVTSFHLIMAGAILGFFILFLWMYFHPLIFMTFDKQVARISGIPVERLDSILLVFLAFIIVISMKIVGIILISALIVLPASFGQAGFLRYRTVMLASILYAFFMMIGGLFLSVLLNTPAGATIAVFGTLIYLIYFVIIKAVKT